MNFFISTDPMCPSPVNATCYHTSNSHECIGVNKTALQLHAVYYFLLLQVTLESVPVLQVMQEFVLSTTSHVHASEHAMKLKVKSLSLYYQVTPEKILLVCFD